MKKIHTPGEFSSEAGPRGLYSTKEKSRRAFLVGIQDEKTSKAEAASLTRELAGLTGTLGLEIAAQETVRIRERHAQYGMGTGKAAEIAERAAGAGVDCIIFDREISPSQQRNWEKLTNVAVVDRQELIIQIFAGRAQTREAELQVALAELNYSLPRLQHKYIDLSRQRGGRYGTRGSGETKLETDRRLVEQRIRRLEDELEAVRRQRQVQRRQRERQGIPVCALVGYTNAGKSSLLNALTLPGRKDGTPGVPVEDKLFATLDAVSRRLELERGLTVLLVDTVGFIRQLPHSLIKAFHSTLEEAALADLLIHVLDAADPDAEKQYETTLKVLGELKADKINRITVLNKADRAEVPEASVEDTGRESPPESLESLLRRYPKSIPVSALTGSGLPELMARMKKELANSGFRSHWKKTW